MRGIAATSLSRFSCLHLGPTLRERAPCIDAHCYLKSSNLTLIFPPRLGDTRSTNRSTFERVAGSYNLRHSNRSHQTEQRLRAHRRVDKFRDRLRTAYRRQSGRPEDVDQPVHLDEFRISGNELIRFANDLSLAIFADQGSMHDRSAHAGWGGDFDPEVLSIS